MTRDDITSKVLTAVAEEADKPTADIRLEERFVEDLAFDSLAVVELVMELEDEFEISIPDEDAQQLKSVGNVIDYLDAVLNKAGAV